MNRSVSAECSRRIEFVPGVSTRLTSRSRSRRRSRSTRNSSTTRSASASPCCSTWMRSVTGVGPTAQTSHPSRTLMKVDLPAFTSPTITSRKRSSTCRRSELATSRSPPRSSTPRASATSRSSRARSSSSSASCSCSRRGAIVAIHDTTLGPALGGLRMWKYASKDEALTDVLRLARGMTFKSAVARTGLGGGKSVVIGDAQKDKSDELFFWLGRVVDHLGGKYITAEDVGTSVLDLDLVARETKWVTGRAREVGGSGDPSPFTALGAFVSIQTALKEANGRAEGK